MIISQLMSRQGLRSFLSELSAISERLSQLKLSNTIADTDDSPTEEAEMLTERARRLVSNLNLDMLGAVLPDRLGLFFKRFFAHNTY